MGKAKTKSPWDVLRELVEVYADAARADEMKGGGDPEHMEICELEFRLAQIRVHNQIAKLQREYE
jgi:hypothetical protein